MTCREMDDVISSRSGGSDLDPRPAEHLIHCERCHALTRLLEDAGGDVRPSERLLLRIRTGILENLRPIRPLAPFRILLCGCAVVFLSAVVVGALLLGMKGWVALSLVQRAAVFLTLAASAALLAVSMVRQMVPGARHAFAPAGPLVVIPLVLTMVIACLFRPLHEASFRANGLTCLKTGLLYAIPAAFLLWIILRRGAILYPKRTGVAAGGLAGLAGLTVLEINCPNLDLFHILAWHGSVVAIDALAGALFGAAMESIER